MPRRGGEGVSLAGLNPDGLHLNLTVLRTGEPVMSARLGSGGPIISLKAVDEFALDVIVHRLSVPI